MVRPRPAGDGALITADLSAADVDRFRDLVERHLGLRFGDDARHHLARVLHRRLEVAGLSAEAYLARTERNPYAEMATLASELTIGETYFLRHTEQFHALVRTVVPERLARRRRTGRTGLTLLSAGCATGEEAYSLAIALRESAAPPAGVSVLGVDVNPVALEKAQAGRYSSWSMRGRVSDQMRRAWFRTEGEEEVVEPAIRAQVRFERRNFTLDDPGLWSPERFDVVFCRNVLMYFSTELMTAVIGRISRALAPGGYLFLGSAETLRTIRTDLQLRQSDGAFYYRKPEDGDDGGAGDGGTATTTAHPAPAVVARRPAPPGGRPAGPGPQPAPAADLAPVLDLLTRERFAEALEALDAQLTPGTGEPQARVLRASLQLAVGDRRGAEHAAYRLTSDPAPDRATAAAARLLLTMCAEAVPDLGAAVAHCRAALEVDPGHALARMHLGRLLLRGGDAAAARLEFDRAAHRLPLASDLDVLLFGGGFDRSSLVAYCENQAVTP